MKHLSFRIAGLPVSIKISRFSGKDGTDEFYIAIYPYKIADFITQTEWIYRAYMQTLKHIGIELETAVFCRLFFSDIVNQWSVFEKTLFYSSIYQNSICSVSAICQPPGPVAKISLWAYHIKDKKNPLNKKIEGTSLILTRDNLIHYWTTGLVYPELNTPYEQTTGILEKYSRFLNTSGMTLRDNVIRTWFFIQNIDTNYKEFVDARREYYEKNGLTKDTHFIASTGIQGSSREISTKVLMDACAISGIKKEQIQFLSAPDYLSPTYIYGVTFERGTAISYRDRKQIFISGTASIDNKGNILYPGDVMKQLDRTLTNIEALLKSAGATFKNMAIFIVYVRDPSDYTLVMREMKHRFRNTPVITSYASVCRPGWLIEIEGIAIIPFSNHSLPSF